MLYAYTVILVILALMLTISLRLLLSRRKKAYFSMTVSLTFLLMNYAILFFIHANQAMNPFLQYSSNLLQVISFILVNMGIFQLYNPTRRRQYLFFYSLIFFAVVISPLYFYIPTLMGFESTHPLAIQNIGLDIYMFILIVMWAYMIPPLIGQSRKYQLALLLYCIYHISQLLNSYMFESEQPFLSIVEHVGSVLFYFILFSFLFERVVELMNAIYTSSITDGLTRVYNRKYFYQRLANYLSHNITVAIIFSDIDNFKKLNDTKGHQSGDEALQQVSQIMQSLCEDYGIVGRYGGEEIVAMITDPAVPVGKFAETFRKRVEAETCVTVSVGYAVYQIGQTPDELIGRADAAMYQAKTTGKNKVYAFR
ncbi:GGDEF domain-containing protein [Paenibacillus sp. N1-5-1-14]|uniref:GGDEF domain-containing protein n=1 Tax=Paenibacillus radicibacter TaxID=2972488 RepID=UPI0021597362|nr:GGDEF domain-containing protein [Paenibacillus radicibacter]MCR8643914.1 GGDEF domain-containing protein [Paenibacillus radicibacter]